MFLKRIKNITGYKSYLNFCWDDTCIPILKQEESETEENFARRVENASDFGKFNVIFGENGSGKTALIEILKNCFGMDDFNEDYPKNVDFVFKDRESQFDGNKWANYPEKNGILVFDSKFIRKNIHIHGERPGSEGEVKQNATKLLLTLSDEARRLSEQVGSSREQWVKFDSFTRDSRKEVLENDTEKGYFLLYKTYSKNQKNKAIDEKEESLKSLNISRENLKIKTSKHDQIKNIEIDGISIKPPIFSSFREYSLLFKTKIEKQAISEANIRFFNKIETDQNFYNQVYQKIKTGEDDKCPVCEKPLGEIINTYNEYFDTSFEKAKEDFLSKSTKYENEIKDIKTFYQSFRDDIAKILSQVQNIQYQWKLFEKVDFIKKKEEFELYFDENIFDQLLSQIGEKRQLKKVLFIKKDYLGTYNQLRKIIKAFNNFKKFTDLCVKEILDYKKDNINIEDLNEQLKGFEDQIISNQQEIDFLKSDKVEKEILRKSLSKRFRKLDSKYKFWRQKHIKYLGSSLHQKQVERMQAIINEKFHVNFKLKVRQNARVNNIEVPFDFEIKKGNKPINFSNLSEGERQIISLSFFFASIEDNPNIDKIIVFDDPVSSMDARNLKMLSDLIAERAENFSQLFILTHHDLFYKYCVKNLGCLRFGLIKNSFQPIARGRDIMIEQSILYRESDLDIAHHINNMKEHINSELLNGNFNYEAFVLKYGQFLRYMVEDFIKNRLLHWQWKRDKDFIQIIDGIKTSARYEEEELNDVKKIYNFCNWSNTNHIDKEEISSLQELKENIERFITIYNK